MISLAGNSNPDKCLSANARRLIWQQRRGMIVDHLAASKQAA
jgi:succinate dehydrogenase flavin-adding protein (antitoxin of CptAB toxin-antitoxin module)